MIGHDEIALNAVDCHSAYVDLRVASFEPDTVRQ
jgi:hypothetical protein